MPTANACLRSVNLPFVNPTTIEANHRTVTPALTGNPRVTVSIIIPCFNGARYLSDTLRSAVSQSRPPLEVIVIDDGSTDDSAAIAESVGPPVRVIRQTNQGESAARNRGIELARGTHLLFLDADDLLDPDALRHLAGALDEHPGSVGLMGCAWFNTGDPEQPHTSKLLEYPSFFPYIIETNFGPPLCWLAPIEAVRQAGGFCETLRWFEDWDLWWRVGLDEPTLISVPFIGARYRQHPQSQLATTKPDDRARGHAALITRMAEGFRERPRLLASYGNQLFWCAWTALDRARSAGVEWSELEPLSRRIADVASKEPGGLVPGWTPRLVRLFGVRFAHSISGQK